MRIDLRNVEDNERDVILKGLENYNLYFNGFPLKCGAIFADEEEGKVIHCVYDCTGFPLLNHREDFNEDDELTYPEPLYLERVGKVEMRKRLTKPSITTFTNKE